MKNNTYLLKLLSICFLISGSVILNPATLPSAFSGTGITDFKTCPTTILYSNDVPTPGVVYTWAESDSNLNKLTDTIYLAGNIPILITVPHGGSQYETVSDTTSPLYLPDRSTTCGTTTTDAFTLDLALEILKQMEVKFGGIPHIIINRLPRTKIDQNRTLTEECNPKTRARGIKAWNDFHVNFKKKAVDTILAQTSKGLYIDLHGKPDNYGASVHVGYHLTSADLTNYSDTSLNNESNRYIGDSSIRFLYKNLKQNNSSLLFTTLLRESRSYGTILESYVNTIADSSYTFHVAPRTDARKPSPYFSGEYNLLHFCGGTHSGTDYNTATYGNAYTSAKFISGFQIETGYRLRDMHRAEYAEKIALAVKDYMTLNYGYSGN